jgi:putative phosphoesterase
MIRIGLLSDTHGHLDDRIFKHFEEVDEIWHAGDIGNLSLADTLDGFKPLRAVYGNIDGHELRVVHPEVQLFIAEQVKVLMIHIGGYPSRYNRKTRKLIEEHQPDLVITGHSHILKVMYDKALNHVHMNPGAAGKQGFHKVRTLIRFAINGKKIENPQVIELGLR